MEWAKDVAARVELEITQRGKCKEATDARAACVQLYGESASSCIPLKLREKECLAAVLCPREHFSFYMGERSCASIVEEFSRGLEDGSGDVASRSASSVKIPRRCRDATYDLNRCLHKFTKTK